MLRVCLVAGVVAVLGACEGPVGDDKSGDLGIDARSQADQQRLQAGIWVDPKGCDHWIIDDGVEGYMDARLDRYGKPICSGIAPPNTTVGPFKQNSPIGDIF